VSADLFNDVLGPDETLLWVGRPAPVPTTIKSVLALLGVAALGFYGATQIGLAILDSFGVGRGAFRLTRANPGLDLVIALLILGIATLILFARRSGQKRRSRLIYAMSERHIFQAVDNPRARTASVATVFHRGAIEVTRRPQSVDVLIAIHGPCSEEAPQFGIFGLSPEDAEIVLAHLKREEGGANV
jgi:hypothetical protein